MNNISEITRQDILDIIKGGFMVYLDEPTYDSNTGDYITEYPVIIPFYGRIDEISFLSRIYDLEKMPSKDRRYRNALGDISCHLRFGDYDDDFWFFSDDRFNLRHGDGDEQLLKFLCEMLHPAVRNEKSDWKLYLDKFNELLRVDGYELYPAQHISGRDVYGVRNYIEPTQPRFPDSLFTERYKKLVVYGQGQSIDNISGSVDSKAKKHICKILLEFREPMCYQPNRYDSWTKNTDALAEAVRRLNEHLEAPVVDLHMSDPFSCDPSEILAENFTPFLFDIIELQYDELSPREKTAFQAEINTSLQRDNVSFKLNDSGLIEQLAVHEVLTSDIIALSTQIQEPGLRELFDLAIEKHMQPNLQSHKDAVEKLWDVLERLKTYYSDLDKKQSVNKIIEDMACSQDAYKTLFSAEFNELTTIGNKFRIRHHETNKIDIVDIRHYDYFFNRCLSLIALALQYLR